ncbi:MAG: hypothetical protein GXP04_07325 [Alphaproteobacteria bacterium]|nr:hypothetical protein [Alphaproteobacteria bacterium]
MNSINENDDARRIVKAILQGDFGTHGLIKLIQIFRPKVGGCKALHALATLLAHPDNYKYGFIQEWSLKAAKSQLHYLLKPEQHVQPNAHPSMAGPFPGWSKDVCRARLDLYYNEFMRGSISLSPPQIQRAIKKAYKGDEKNATVTYSAPTSSNEEIIIAQLYSVDRLSCMITKETLFNDFYSTLLKSDAVFSHEHELLKENLLDKLFLLYMCSLNNLRFDFPGDDLWGYRCEYRLYVHPSNNCGPYKNPDNLDRVQVQASMKFSDQDGNFIINVTRVCCFSDLDVNCWVVPKNLESSLYGKKIGPMKVTGSYFHEITDEFKIRLF